MCQEVILVHTALGMPTFIYPKAILNGPTYNVIIRQANILGLLFSGSPSHSEAARASEQERWSITCSHWDDANLHYRFVDGDIELVPGVELIETSGHVPGHQAVLVCLPQTGPILLAIDAAALG